MTATDDPVTTSAEPADTEAASAPTTDASTSAPVDVADSEAPSTDAPAPVANDAPATTGAADASQPDDGCSADNTATDVAAGPVPAIEVRAASAGTPLPDVAVRRINCAGGWVNFKNELPSDKPMLVWFWAPH